MTKRKLTLGFQSELIDLMDYVIYGAKTNGVTFEKFKGIYERGRIGFIELAVKNLLMDLSKNAFDVGYEEMLRQMYINRENFRCPVCNEFYCCNH